MTGDDRPAVPPVQLPSDAELARDALASPLIARAARLARWAEDPVRVGAGGELLDGRLKEAAAYLGLDGDEDGAAHTAQAWNLAVDTGLLEIEEDEEGGRGGEPREGGGGDAAVATAAPGEALKLLTAGGPADVLEVWRDGLETVLADAAMPSLEDLVDGLAAGTGGRDGADAAGSGGFDLGSLDWDPEEEADFLDNALAGLYVLTATDSAAASGAMVPLPVLAASLVVPDDVDEPTDEILAEVSEAMMKLDDRFRTLEPIGLVAYRPVDDSLVREASGESGGGDEDGDDEDVTRYGMVRLTPLGLYGVRQRMVDAGIRAPLVGDLAEAGAEELLAALPRHGEACARTEIELWLARRTPLEAARALLDAARGDDAGAPRRRLDCQQVLSLVGTEAEPALRDVLDDPHLGGLARVWLSEHGRTDVPPPSEETVFWLTVDTLAAQLAEDGGGGGRAGEEAELRDLVRSLVDRHTGFFDKVWRVDHPATGRVLEAVGRVHPDRQAAKEARKAAYRARSRG